MLKPRTFGEFLTLSKEERRAEFKQWLEEALASNQAREAEYLAGDYDKVASHQRQEIGE